MINTMVTETSNPGLLELIKKMDNRLEIIELEVKEIRDEIGLEVRHEYIEKLKRIQKEKGKTFGNKDEFLNYLKNEL